MEMKFVRRLQESWLAQQVTEGSFEPESFPQLDLIESLAAKAQALGPQPLWEGYGQPQATRTSNRVRTGKNMGAFYHWLVRQRTPDIVVEVGTAFGVSGMFWLSGLVSNRRGHLFTFDPNDVWRSVAVRNLSAIGDRYTSIHGTFEDCHTTTLPDLPVDICFIDAIHTSAFVYPQFEILKRRMRDGGIMVFDDIRFSSDMTACWNDLSCRPEVVSSMECSERVGLVEIRRAD